MNRRTYRIKWIRQHGIYVKIGFRNFSRSIRLSLQQMPWGEIDENNYESIVTTFVTDKPITKAYQDFYTSIGLLHGKKTGIAINQQQKNFNPFTFSEAFKKFIVGWILENSMQKVTSVRQSVIKELIRVFAEGIDRGDNIETVARNIRKTVNNGDFYRWQSMRIARTEATGAANLGTIKASEASGVELTKEWISSIDKRTRRNPKSEFDHVDMDGVVVDEKQPFNVNGDLIQFPGDPNGEPGNIINCRCAIAMLIKRDSNGRIIFKPNPL